DNEKKTFVTYIRASEEQAEDDNDDEEAYQIIKIAYLNKCIHWYAIEMVLASAANTITIQFQDLLGLDDSTRMNNPASFNMAQCILNQVLRIASLEGHTRYQVVANQQ
ncbi:unnamed protein product, partial [Rotaria sp. Silwood2]